MQEACLHARRHFESFSAPEETSTRARLLAIVRNAAFSAGRRRRAEDVATEFDEKTHSDAVVDGHPEAGDALATLGFASLRRDRV